MRPAKTRAVAPVMRFCTFDSFGRTELLFEIVAPFARGLAEVFATIWRRELSDVKYRADPKPVRRAEGTVPRQRLAMGWGPERMDRRTATSDEERDCWTRVFSRSAGCRSTALETPEAKPAKKWKVGCAFLELLTTPSDMFQLSCSQVGRWLEEGVDGGRWAI